MYLFPSDKTLRRMGYFDDQEGIVRRFINEENNWNGHLDKTKSYIEKSVDLFRPNNVAVLGSGWMLDIPVEFLSGNCSKVFFYDIRHPRQVLHKYRNLKNVYFVNQDITGGVIEEVYHILNESEGKFEQLDEISPAGFSASEPIDCVISANILNQLDILLIEYLRKFKFFGDYQFDKFRASIQQAHIDSISSTNACVITDYEEMIHTNKGKFTHSNPLLFIDLPAGRNTEEWIWKFDTNMTYYPDRITYFKVKALQLN